MNNYFRAQSKGYTFKQMQNFNSADGGDGCENAGGLCACLTVADLLRNTVMGAMYDNDEVIVIGGYKITEIYDGYRIDPVKEIARFTVKYFRENAESIAEKYETW
jgi:hypothetical protein